MSDSVVRVRGVDKVFGAGADKTPALEHIDLEIPKGAFVSLIGPSGCGKSTLLRLIGDLTQPSAGTIEVNGKTAHRARLDRDDAFGAIGDRGLDRSRVEVERARIDVREDRRRLVLVLLPDDDFAQLFEELPVALLALPPNLGDEMAHEIRRHAVVVQQRVVDVD